MRFVHAFLFGVLGAFLIAVTESLGVTDIRLQIGIMLAVGVSIVLDAIKDLGADLKKALAEEKPPEPPVR